MHSASKSLPFFINHINSSFVIYSSALLLHPKKYIIAHFNKCGALVKLYEIKLSKRTLEQESHLSIRWVLFPPWELTDWLSLTLIIMWSEIVAVGQSLRSISSQAGLQLLNVWVILTPSQSSFNYDTDHGRVWRMLGEWHYGPCWKIHSFLSEVSVCWSCTEKITIKIERAFSVILRGLSSNPSQLTAVAAASNSRCNH